MQITPAVEQPVPVEEVHVLKPVLRYAAKREEGRLGTRGCNSLERQAPYCDNLGITHKDKK